MILSALGLLIKKYLFGVEPNYILGVIAAVLFILSIILIVETYNTLVKNKSKSVDSTKSL